ncbi:MAG: hypothetical protein WCF85_07110 [Rhodospirillaceae bacterium]
MNTALANMPHRARPRLTVGLTAAAILLVAGMAVVPAETAAGNDAGLLVCFVSVMSSRNVATVTEPDPAPMTNPDVERAPGMSAPIPPTKALDLSSFTDSDR